MEVSCEFNEPSVKHSIGGIMPGMFDDDIKFTFEARDVHITDPAEIEKMLADFDKCADGFRKAMRDYVSKKK